MKIAKRIVLFLAVNVLVMVAISFVVNILGIRPYMESSGINLTALAAFCLLWGFGGAFISLALSRVMAKWMMGVRVIDPATRIPEEQELLQTVHRLSRAAGLQAMPEVGVYDSPEINAFATGPTKNRALVAVSSGLLHGMNRHQVEGVLGHEVAHIANGDMVTMTLLQGVVNAFVMFLARILAWGVSQAVRGRDGEDSGISGFAHMALVMVFELAFMVLGSVVVAWFSRYREYRADIGGARLAGRESMISALRALQKVQSPNEEAMAEHSQPALQGLKIYGRRQSKILKLFSSHPPLEERIQRLESARGL